MDSWAILGIYIVILHIAQGRKYTSEQCEESEIVISYWRFKYEKDYEENYEPDIRCDKVDGFCLSDNEKCDGSKKRWQTTCYDKCICCFDEENEIGKKNEDWKALDLIREKKTWEDAQDYCRDKDGELLVPENVWDVIGFLRDEDMGKTDVWVGINDYYQGYFEGVNGNYISSGWKYDQPRLEADKQDNCVVVEDEREDPGLKVEPCYAKNAFICDFSYEARSKDRHPIFLKKKKKSSKRKSTKYDNWSSWKKTDTKLDSAQYGVNMKIEPKRLTWKKAREECQSRGGDLHIPSSIGDMIVFMRDEGIGSRDIWIGYSDISSSGVYEGVHNNTIISGWQSGQPAAMKPGDDCIAVEDDEKDGIGMKVEPCEEKHMFMCDTSDEYKNDHDTKEY